MVVLGLHFGHDSSVCVLRHGEIRAFVEKERLSRLKYAIGLSADDILYALDVAGIALADVDCVALTSTQDLEYLLLDDRLHIGFGIGVTHALPTPFVAQQARIMLKSAAQPAPLTGLIRSGKHAQHVYARMLDAASIAAIADGSSRHFPSLDQYGSLPEWDAVRRTADLATAPHAAMLADDRRRHFFHFPVTVRLLGRSLPAYVVSHHMAHVAYGFYQSGFERALVVSHDGYSDPGYAGGMIYWGDGTKLTPLVPHHLTIGLFYTDIADQLGFGRLTGEGKLMGLSAWGVPRYFDRAFVGNWFDVAEPYRNDHSRAGGFLLACRERAPAQAASQFGRPEFITQAFNADVAASAQRIFEETVLDTVRSALDGLSGVVDGPIDLVMTGGSALNCPANTRLARETGVRAVFVPPGCSDLGLSIGSALALHHNAAGQPRRLGAPCAAYATRQYAEADWLALADRVDGEAYRIERHADTTALAARLLADDKIIGWFEGGGEIGPRALGHRSILAHPGHERNWQRVNRIKGREAWRPLAPAVLEEAAADWFADCPIPSPHMLFTARVRGSDLPAITHVDGSARIQTVTPDAGGFHRLLVRFRDLTGLPILMNTSFNGPGEPIVETPADAFRCFETRGLDALIFPTMAILRTVAASPPPSP